MIRHKTIGPDRDAIRLAGLRQPVLVESIVVVNQEHPLTSISALRYMVRHTGDDNPRKSRHPTIKTYSKLV